MLTQARLMELLYYNPDTGNFRWKVPPSSRIRQTDIAGTIDNKGYRRIGIKGDKPGKYYRAHRLAWLYMTGVWPEDQIDHINGDKDDNRWDNLRSASNAENMRNRPAKGYTFSPRHKTTPWCAQITHNGKNQYLGRYKTKREAEAAYRAAANELWGEFANTK
jgi:hypothetical protein